MAKNDKKAAEGTTEPVLLLPIHRDELIALQSLIKKRHQSIAAGREAEAKVQAWIDQCEPIAPPTAETEGEQMPPIADLEDAPEGDEKESGEDTPTA